jgi:hypothetical protein
MAIWQPSPTFRGGVHVAIRAGQTLNRFAAPVLYDHINIIDMLELTFLPCILRRWYIA